MKYLVVSTIAVLFTATVLKSQTDSIKANETHSQMTTARTPLSQQRPSNTGTDSGNTLSMRDLKKKYRA